MQDIYNQEEIDIVEDVNKTLNKNYLYFDEIFWDELAEEKLLVDFIERYYNYFLPYLDDINLCSDLDEKFIRKHIKDLSIDRVILFQNSNISPKFLNELKSLKSPIEYYETIEKHCNSFCFIDKSCCSECPINKLREKNREN